MAAHIAHPARFSAVAGLLSLAALVVLLGLTSGTTTTHTLMLELARPALRSAPTAGMMTVRVTPNRASVADALAVNLNVHGTPLTGARVTARFSMPSMAMWNVFSIRLHPDGGGSYSGPEPVVGMAGVWQIDIEALTARGRRIHFTGRDRMRR